VRNGYNRPGARVKKLTAIYFKDDTDEKEEVTQDCGKDDFVSYVNVQDNLAWIPKEKLSDLIRLKMSQNIKDKEQHRKNLGKDSTYV
jgi:hypothetical protein